MRRSWYRDSYGHWHRDRQAERKPGRGAMPAKWAVIALMVLARNHRACVPQPRAGSAPLTGANKP